MKVVGIYSLDKVRKKFRSGELIDNWVISISDLADEVLVLGKCKGIMHSKFDDIIESWKGRKPAKSKDISRILDWCRDKDGIVVHCYAGVSRSSAVAYLIECLMTPPEIALGILDINQHCPNMHVVRLGAKILNNPEIVTHAERWKQSIG